MHQRTWAEQMGEALQMLLVADEIHNPAGRNHCPDKQHKAISSIPNHRLGSTSLRDPKNNRSKNRKQNHSSEMRRSNGHGFLPTAMLCASTAEIRFNNPATTTN